MATCRFCGRQGVTREHIWPDWLKRVLPRDPTGYNMIGVGTAVVRGGTATVHPDTGDSRTGHMYSRKLKVACAHCNNGWMSRLQERAKPVLIPLINGQWVPLTPEDQKTLAAWAVMFTMVLELADPRTDAHTFEQRNSFSLLPEPPPDWFVWIGYGNDWPWFFWHYGWELRDGPRPEGQLPECNIQTTTFGVGKLLIHTLSVRDPFRGEGASFLPPHEFAARHEVSILWPPSGASVAMPPRILSSAQIMQVAANLVPLLGGTVVHPSGQRDFFYPSISTGEIRYVTLGWKIFIWSYVIHVLNRFREWWRRIWDKRD